MPVFTLPLALIALSSVSALMAIYWLRNRYRRQTVSSLHLWMDSRTAREGGRRLQRMQLPWLLLLEILALALLATAAADPRVFMGSARRPLVVVLDDSYSMQAGARERAAAALDRLLRRERHFAARLLLARQQPQTLGDTMTAPSQVQAALEGWHCLSPAADLDRALALAYELGGKQARVLVLTDHVPPQDLHEGRLQWWAFGRSRPNVAFVNAARTTQEGRQRVLLEIANFAAAPARTQLSLNGSPQVLELAPGELRRMWLDLDGPTSPFHAQLADDPLPFDNAVTLLPEDQPPVRVRLNVQHEKLAELIRKALDASGRANVTSFGPDLVITDQASTLAAGPESWLARFTVEDDSAAFIGPFLVDDHHPLTDGIQLNGVVWAARQDVPMPGRPLITAGNTPLVAVIDRSGPDSMRYDVAIRLNPEQSSLQSTANFPILIWNLLSWRQSALPGLHVANVRLASQVTLTTKPQITSVQITAPRESAQDVPVHARSVVIAADEPGVYKIAAGDDAYQFAVNVLSGDESDLRQAETTKAGTWVTPQSLRREYTSIAWIGLLAALVVLTLHSFLVARSSGGRA